MDRGGLARGYLRFSTVQFTRRSTAWRESGQNHRSRGSSLFTDTSALPNVTVTATYTASTSLGSTIQVSSDGNLTTTFLKIAGFPTLDITTSSTSAWGMVRMRVAMVLDNTGSMADDGKMRRSSPPISIPTTSRINAPAKDTNYTYKDAIVLLSDGLNTQNRWYSNASQIDARQKKLCDDAKAANITIYTVQVNTGGDATSGVLQYCASSTDKFYLITSASQTVSVFKNIGTSLSKLRVAR